MAEPDAHAIRMRKTVVTVGRVVSYLVYFYLIVVEIILVLGFFLLLFGANPAAGFTDWAYRNLDRVMEPFRGIFTPIQLGTTNGDIDAVLDTSVLFAMIVYGIVAMVFSALINWLTQRMRKLEASEAELAQQEKDRLAAQTPITPIQPWAPTAAPVTAPAASPAANSGFTDPQPPFSPPRT